MGSSALRQRITDGLLREVQDVQFPSVTMLNRLEETFTTRNELEEYAEFLVEKLEATHYPSVALLNRLDGLLARLEQAEQPERA